MTLEPGLYKWGSGLLINTDVALSGPSNGVWIFQIAQDLTVGSGAAIILSGGAQASRIFWQVGGEVNFGTTSHFEGVVLSKTAIHLNSGASINGSLLAQTAVTIQSSTITRVSVKSDTPLHWFGSFTDYRTDPEAVDGWILHCEHGWLYEIETARGVWVWDRIQQDWLWTSEEAYEYFYSMGQDNWIFYVKGGEPALRWFFFYDDQNENKGEWDYVQSGF